MQRLQAPKRSLSSLSHSINRHLTAATYTDSPIHTNIYNNNGWTKDFPQCCSKWFLPYSHHTWKMIHGLSYSITSPFARCPCFALPVHSRRQFTTTKKNAEKYPQNWTWILYERGFSWIQRIADFFFFHNLSIFFFDIWWSNCWGFFPLMTGNICFTPITQKCRTPVTHKERFF